METTESKRFFAELEIVRFDADDVITASCPDDASPIPCRGYSTEEDCTCEFFNVVPCPYNNPPT